MLERGLITQRRICEDTYNTIQRYSATPELMDGGGNYQEGNGPSGKDGYARM